jgi:hypothetical protein
MTKIVNIHKREPYDIYIGRAGRGEDGYFGNPFPLLGGDRKSVLAKYKEYMLKRLEEEFKKRILELKDKTLGCFCTPQLCHGMVIIEYLDGKTVAEQLEEYKKEKRRENPTLFDE